MNRIFSQGVIPGDRVCVALKHHYEPYNIVRVLDTREGIGPDQRTVTIYCSLLRQRIELSTGDSTASHLKGEPFKIGFDGFSLTETVGARRKALLWIEGSDQIIVKTLQRKEWHPCDSSRPE